MPIYDYACTACGHVTEVIHGINDHGPRFCPECGTEGSMRKALSTPAIVFKGSGWAKVDRRGSTTSRGSGGSKAGGTKEAGAGSGDSGEKTGGSGQKQGGSGAAESASAGRKATQGDGGGD